MDLKKYKISLVRYQINKCEIISPNLKENYVVPITSIGDMILDDDYENYYFPYFQINMNLPAVIMRAIKKTPLDIHIKIDIEAQYYSDRENQTLATDSISKFINGTYIAYIENQTRSLLDSNMEDYEDGQGYSSEMVDMNTLEPCKFTLYNEKLLKALDTKVNVIVSSTNMVNALAMVLTAAGISNVLLSPPTNNKVYSPFIMPPYNAKEHMEIICHSYGLHKNGTLIYHGLDRSYILDRQAKCTAYVTNEYQTTFLYYPGGTDNVVNTGCAKSSAEKANLILIQPTTFTFTDLSTAASESIGDDIIALDPFGRKGSGGANADYAMMIGGDDTTSGLEKLTKSYKKTINMSVGNVDISMLTPNKKFTVTIDDIKYKAYTGDYMLVKRSILFTKSGTTHSPMITCSFRS